MPITAKEYIKRVKHANHDQSTHGHRGAGSYPSTTGDSAPKGLPKMFTLNGQSYWRDGPKEGFTSSVAEYSGGIGNLTVDRNGKIRSGKIPFKGKTQPASELKKHPVEVKVNGKWWMNTYQKYRSRKTGKPVAKYTDPDNDARFMFVDEDGKYEFD